MVLQGKQEEIKNSVGFSERTNCIIEPNISTQWFCKMLGRSEPVEIWLDVDFDSLIRVTAKIDVPEFDPDLNEFGKGLANI